MSRKSRRHGRHLSQSKRRKFRKGFAAPAQQSAAAAQPPVAAAQRYEPAPRTDMAVPAVRAPAQRVAVTSAQLPNVAAELRRIGILTGIILVILVVLALVLR